jgi:hypothetical protein
MSSPCLKKKKSLAIGYGPYPIIVKFIVFHWKGQLFIDKASIMCPDIQSASVFRRKKGLNTMRDYI